MHAYFTASIAGKKYHLSHYQTIIEYLKSKGVTVQSDHIINTDESTIHFEERNQRLAFHKKLEGWITNADFIIVEATFPSISVGYEISLAMHRGKSVLVLYSEGDPPSLIVEHEDEHIVCEKYSLQTYKEIINDFLTYVEGSADTRFTFFISSAQSEHLKKAAKTNKMPKSVYLRNLIDKDMKEKK